MKTLSAYVLAMVVVFTGFAEMAYTQSGGGSGTGGAAQGGATQDSSGGQGAERSSQPGSSLTGPSAQQPAGGPSSPTGAATQGQGAIPGASPSTPSGGDMADKDTIQKAQEQLRAAGFDPGSTSGVMDDNTRTALRDYQRSKGLTETGQLDAATQSALLSPGTLPQPGTSRGTSGDAAGGQSGQSGTSGGGAAGSK
jgi:hypothetical protein